MFWCHAVDGKTALDDAMGVKNWTCAGEYWTLSLIAAEPFAEVLARRLPTKPQRHYTAPRLYCRHDIHHECVATVRQVLVRNGTEHDVVGREDLHRHHIATVCSFFVFRCTFIDSI